MHSLAAQRLVRKPDGAPVDGASDLALQIPTRLSLRLAVESLLTGRSADDLAADALALYLDARQAAREKN